MAKEPTKAQKDEAKSLKIRVTKEDENGKRISKTATELTKEISEAKSKIAEEAKAKAAKEKAEADAAVKEKAEADAKAEKEAAEADEAQDEAEAAQAEAEDAAAEAQLEADEANESSEIQDAEVNAFRKAAIGRRWNMHNLIHEAYARFGEGNVKVDKHNNNQVRFDINGKVTPEEGYFTVI